MRKHLRWLALCAGFGLSACTTTLTPRQATAKACADWHRYAIKPAAAECPTIPGWTGEKTVRFDARRRAAIARRPTERRL